MDDSGSAKHLVSHVLRAAGHVGLFAGLYVVGALVCVWQLGGLASEGVETPSWAALLATGLIATGTYALDRVKIRDSWMDPADRAAQPERYAFLTARSGAVRIGALVILVAGGAVGSMVHWGAPIAAALAAAGVVLYAPKPRGHGRRLKDRLGVKNAYVGAGITGFVALVALADASRTPEAGVTDQLKAHGLAIIGACVLIGARTLFDAALCDLDDEGADRMHGTRTLPTTVGRGAAWRITGIARALVPPATLACVWCPWRERLVWAVVGALGVIALRVRRPRMVRDVVDLRFAAEAIVATLALLALRG